MIRSGNQRGDGPYFASCPITEHRVTGGPRGRGKEKPQSPQIVNPRSGGSEIGWFVQEKEEGGTTSSSRLCATWKK